MQDPAEIQTFVERRQTQRAPVTVRIEYGSVDAMFSEFTRNINEGGLFIATEQPLALEEQVQLQFQLPGGDEPVKASGRVVRVQEATADEPSGMGIEFEELDSAARGRINELVLQLRTRG
jgi:uncharacterized protein (TIGR02266 family)